MGENDFTGDNDMVSQGGATVVTRTECPVRRIVTSVDFLQG